MHTIIIALMIAFVRYIIITSHTNRVIKTTSYY